MGWEGRNGEGGQMVQTSLYRLSIISCEGLNIVSHEGNASSRSDMTTNPIEWVM